MTETPRRNAPLALKPDEFRRTGHALVEAIAAFLESMADRPVTQAESQAQVRAALDADARLPEHGSDLETLVTSTANLLFDHSLFNGHPRFYGYITSSPAPVGILGDFLAAAVNANVGAWQLSPMASEIEAQVVRWIAELVGYPRECGGLLLSGGNMANFTALPAALAAHDGAMRARGRASSEHGQLRIYASAETHTWLYKA
ncbi:MAG: pyridoxal-dependent decarboxylase, partial [Longimicrobiales bacterium]